MERSTPDVAQTSAHWFRGRDRGRTNNGSACRLLFLHSPRRASRTSLLSALEHHRYVQVLDWKVACEFQITVFGAAVDHLQVHADRAFQFIFKSCERLRRVARKSLGRVRAASRISMASRLPIAANAASI